MNNIHVISDTHFFHKKLSEVWGRPKDFDQRLEKNLNLLTRDDILIHCGDVCIGNDHEAHARFIKPLLCKKWLVRGNHDGKSNNWYLNNGWDFVCYKFQDKFFGKTIVFSHIPQYKEKTKIIDLLYGAGNPDINIHGHLHDTMHRLGENKGPYKKTFHKLVAVELTDYKPVKLKTLVEEVCEEQKNQKSTLAKVLKNARKYF